MASVFYLMAQEKYFAFCMVPFTFVQAAFKFIILSFYLHNSLFSNKNGGWTGIPGQVRSS